MEPSFRASMTWLHTWAGLVLGGVLFAIFWTGTLSVFDREIDRWMAPMTRLAAPKSGVSIEALRPLLERAAAAQARTLFLHLPTEREPTIRLTYRDASGSARLVLDPANGAALPDPGTLAGSQFLYPFHYMLHVRLWQLGIWLVGLSSMAMLALCVSGVIVHRKIFADFFTFRADKKPRRLILDLHNVTGVLAMPFHIAITLSGLIIFWSIYFPGSGQLGYLDRQTFNAELFGTFTRPRLAKPGELGPLDAMASEAQRLWGGEQPRYVFVRNLGDAAAYVQIGRSDDSKLGGWNDIAYFDAATGTLLHVRAASKPVMTVQRFISDLHLIRFRHWTLRWAYFGLGLSGCVMIATGYLFWLESRRRKHAQLGLRGVPVVEGLTIGSVSGIVIATLSFFVVNRLLPLGATFLGEERAALEVWTFYLVWLATFAHAWLRPGRGWIEQCWVIAVLAVAGVLLNWITTGDHLIQSLSHRHLWPIAGMDLLLLGGALSAALTARKLRHRASTNSDAATASTPARFANDSYRL